jgi:hypothetical protein
MAEQHKNPWDHLSKSAQWQKDYLTAARREHLAAFLA